MSRVRGRAPSQPSPHQAMAKGFKHVKRDTDPDGPGPGRPRKGVGESERATSSAETNKHHELAESLWSNDYSVLLRAHAAERPELAVLVQNAVAELASTYEQRGLASVANAERHRVCSCAEGAAERQQKSAARRERNRKVTVVQAAHHQQADRLWSHEVDAHSQRAGRLEPRAPRPATSARQRSEAQREHRPTGVRGPHERHTPRTALVCRPRTSLTALWRALERARREPPPRGCLKSAVNSRARCEQPR